MNKYLTKLAEQKKDNPDRIPNAIASGMAGGVTGAYAYHEAAPLVQHGIDSLKSKYEGVGDDVSDHTINSFIKKHKLEGTHLNTNSDRFKGVNLKQTSMNMGGIGPHALSNEYYARKSLHKARKLAKPGDESVSLVDDMLKNKNHPGYVHMGEHKSGGVLLHELGHIANQQKYKLGTIRNAIKGNKLDHIAPGAMLFDKDHADDAWKAHLLTRAPELADELGTNIRAYRHIKAHQPHALPKAKGFLGHSAASYVAANALSTGAYALAGHVSKNIREGLDKQSSENRYLKKLSEKDKEDTKTEPNQVAKPQDKEDSEEE